MGQGTAAGPGTSPGGVQAKAGSRRSKPLVNRTLEERNALVLEYLPLVRTQAARLSRYYPIAAQDLESHGMIGLIQAAESWDSTKGTKESTWFSLRISGSILDGIRDHDRVGRHLRNKRKKAGLPEFQFTSMDKFHGDGDGDDYSTCFRADDDPTLSAEQDDMLEYLMTGLCERDRLIVKLYVRHGMTMKKIATQIASMRKGGTVAASRISQLWKENILPHMKLRAQEMAA